MYTSDGQELLKAATRSMGRSEEPSASTPAEEVWWSYEVQALAKRFGAALTRHVARPGGGALVEVDLSQDVPGVVWGSVALVALVPAGYPWRARPVISVVDRRGSLGRDCLAQLAQCVEDALASAAAAGGPTVFFAADRAAATLREARSEGAAGRRPAPGSAAGGAQGEGASEEKAVVAPPSTPERAAVAASVARGRRPRGRKPWPDTSPPWGGPAAWAPPSALAVPPFPLGPGSVQPQATVSSVAAGVGSGVPAQQVDDGTIAGRHLGTTSITSSTAASLSDSDSGSSGFSSDSSTDCEDIDDEMQSVHQELQQNIRKQLLKNNRGSGAVLVPPSEGPPRHGRSGRLSA